MKYKYQHKISINEKTHCVGTTHILSFMSVNNKSCLEDADIIYFDLHDFEAHGHKYQNVKKRIYIDSTYELMESSVLKILSKYHNLSNVYYFYNPRSPSYCADLVQNLKYKQLKLRPHHYFLTYANEYIPDYNLAPLPKKRFLCLTGKVNPYRTFLIALLSKHNLLEHGHVSYFGSDHYIDDFCGLYNEEDFEQVPWLSDNSKQFIRDEIKHISLPITADVDKFSSVMSHSRSFNAQLYKAVDFAIVPETFGCTVNEEFFPTEKTAKCILMNKKIIPVGSQHFLKNLKNYYKRQFNEDISHLTDWCDTSYDDEPAVENRIKKVVELIASEVNNR